MVDELDGVADNVRRLLCLGFETTVGLMAILLAVIFAFGAIIQSYEADREIEDNILFVTLLREIKQNITAQQYTDLLKFVDRDDEKGLQGFTHFIEDLQWSKTDAVAITGSASYAFDLASTIGYGAFTAKTDGGRAWSIVCIIVCFPLAVLAYTRLANFIYDAVASCLIKADSGLSKVVDQYGKDGYLNRPELLAIFRDLDINITEDQIEHILTKHDLNNDGKIDLEEFEAFCVEHKIKVGLLARPNFAIEFAIIAFTSFSLLYMVLAITILEFDVFSAFYFTIITTSTVGLGDIVAEQEYRPLFSFFAFIGIGFTALLLKATVDKLFDRTDYKSHFFRNRMNSAMQKESNASNLSLAGQVESAKVKDDV